MIRRDTLPPRADWRARLEAIGFDFHGNGSYWTEGGCYRFDAAAIDLLEDAGNTLHAMCLDAVEAVVAAGDYAPLGIGDVGAVLVERSWHAREPSLYGRMDIGWDGEGSPKLLEYNADTPTALLEASVAQWHWLEDTGAGADQFNRLHEALVARWREVAPGDAPVWFAAHLDADEDRVTLDYLRDTLLEAGGDAPWLDMSDVGWNGRAFVDRDDLPIARLFKLYPWEWMLSEPFGAHLPAAATRWIEPAWKQVLSNKSLLPLLWNRHRGHPLLLPASHDPADVAGPLVAKPRFGREGEGVRLLQRAPLMASPGEVYQAATPLFHSPHGHAVFGVWIVGDAAAGLGVREDDGPVTRDGSRFVPHAFD